MDLGRGTRMSRVGQLQPPRLPALLSLNKSHRRWGQTFMGTRGDAEALPIFSSEGLVVDPVGGTRMVREGELWPPRGPASLSWTRSHWSRRQIFTGNRGDVKVLSIFLSEGLVVDSVRVTRVVRKGKLRPQQNLTFLSWDKSCRR
jgi:hypothetical protein